MTFMPQSQNSVDPVKLKKLAEVAVKVGLNLQQGQDLVITAPERPSANCRRPTAKTSQGKRQSP